ncbi:hypothetical protein TNCT_320531 [Trichonephila clavata]|uniref:Uncharacterized protein n=1 Tax=Trichonephila clavata TaxID=2740835 RepID=A0A8X6M0F0_TRICU|nr:hypothetical protein TNCT_320531 [Trichonephila clavata]
MVADSLSRVSEIEMPSPIDYKEFAKAQLLDKELLGLNSCNKSLKLNFVKDRIKKYLVPPYSGPHIALSRTPKHVTIEVEPRKQTISVDRLKPAFQLSEVKLNHVRFSV